MKRFKKLTPLFLGLVSSTALSATTLVACATTQTKPQSPTIPKDNNSNTNTSKEPLQDQPNQSTPTSQPSEQTPATDHQNTPEQPTTPSISNTSENNTQSETTPPASGHEFHRVEAVIPNERITYDPSNDYYAPLNGLKGMELFKALVKLQNSKPEKHTYGDLKGFYDEKKAFKDIYFEKDNSLLDVYSENPNGKDSYEYQSYAQNGGDSARTEGQGVNREHIIPQSWFKKVDQMRNDPIHVWPVDIKVNSLRGNDPYDYVATVQTTTTNGGKKGIAQGVGGQAFEPIDTFKGDLARVYFYFAITYGGNGKNITATAQAAKVFSQMFPYLNPHYKQVYMEWNANDPVDAFDVQRNNETAKYASGHRRNPFIDYPDLVNKIFGNDTSAFVNKGIKVVR